MAAAPATRILPDYKKLDAQCLHSVFAYRALRAAQEDPRRITYAVRFLRSLELDKPETAMRDIAKAQELFTPLIEEVLTTNTKQLRNLQLQFHSDKSGSDKTPEDRSMAERASIILNTFCGGDGPDAHSTLRTKTSYRTTGCVFTFNNRPKNMKKTCCGEYILAYVKEVKGMLTSDDFANVPQADDESGDEGDRQQLLAITLPGTEGEQYIRVWGSEELPLPAADANGHRAHHNCELDVPFDTPMCGNWPRMYLRYVLPTLLRYRHDDPDNEPFVQVWPNDLADDDMPALGRFVFGAFLQRTWAGQDWEATFIHAYLKYSDTHRRGIQPYEVTEDGELQDYLLWLKEEVGVKNNRNHNVWVVRADAPWGEGWEDLEKELPMKLGPFCDIIIGRLRERGVID